MMSTDGPSQGEPGIQWWTEPEENAGSAVRDTLDSIKRDQDLFRQANLTHMRMYRNLAMVGLGPHTGFAVSANLGSPLSLNVVRNMCNAVQSKIAKNRPKPWFQTSGADVKTQQKAKKLEQYIKGVFYAEKVYQKTARTFLDATIFGTGVLKVMPGKGCVKIERVFTPEVVVDNVEGMHCEPRNVYRYKYIDRGNLMKQHPDHAEAIKEIRPLEYNSEDEEIIAVYDRYSSDLVRVEEAYHTASEEGADDGRYVMSANGITLVCDEWRHDWHPYLFERWSTSPLGMWGMGLAEELRGIQLEINRIVKSIQSAMMLLSNPYVMADRASNIARGHITDVQGSIIIYTGKKPDIVAPGVVHPEVFQQLDRLYQKAYEIAGVSQMTAQSQKPTGFTSGRSQLVHQDIESERFAIVTREHEEFVGVALPQLILKVSHSVPGIKVKSFGDHSYTEIDFKKDLDVTEDDYVLQVMPTSVLGDTPEAAIEMAEKLTKAGLISEPSQVLKQMDHPDMKALVDRATAPRTLVELTVQGMLDGGPQAVPVEETDLKLTLTVATEMYVQAVLQKYEEKNLAKVRAFMKTCVRMQTSTGGTQQAGAAGAAAMLPPGPPGAVPMPPNGFTPGVAGPVALPPNGFTPGVTQ
jgi:hypothetical protein